MEALEVVRDIAVVVLASVGLLAALMLVITGLLLWRMLAAIRAEVTPIIDSARDTVDTVRATAETVQETVAASSRTTSRGVRVARHALGLLRGQWR